MGEFDWGIRPIASTAASASNPTTATLVAEVDATAINAAITAGIGSLPCQVNWVVGCSASTTGQFLLEHCLSTGLGSTAIYDQTLVFTPAGQSGQFNRRYLVTNGDLFRVRMASTVTGTVSAKIQVEPWT